MVVMFWGERGCGFAVRIFFLLSIIIGREKKAFFIFFLILFCVNVERFFLISAEPSGVLLKVSACIFHDFFEQINLKS